MSDRSFKVVMQSGGFFVAPISYNAREAKASERERDDSFKRAVALGITITAEVTNDEGDFVTAHRPLAPEDRKRFGLTEDAARKLAQRLTRSRIRNGVRARKRA